MKRSEEQNERRLIKKKLTENSIQLQEDTINFDRYDLIKLVPKKFTRIRNI